MSTVDIKDIAIEYFLKTKSGEKLKQAMETFESFQEMLMTLSNSTERKDLVLLKAGTVLVLSLFGKFCQKHSLKDLDEKDWADILKNVSKYGILMDGAHYSEMVFRLYADYIDVSVLCITKLASKEKIKAIKKLAKEIRDSSDKFNRGKITEPEYIERCLWLCLEAMIKLMSATLYSSIGKVAGEEYQRLAEAVTAFGFEYARLALYKKENAVLQECLDNQKQLDTALESQYKEYLAALEKETERFETLIEKAFSPEFERMFSGSVELARNSGVKESEIISTEEDVDEFFLD
ncbi:hypothetical protein [Oribacterium sp. FC2011]|uniref:hypothetical protein n=1 Tax=Oribacterium sp. FC2011 TaxID=1408311 RepID=UPI0004E1C8BE|nr:hypothetical protein [Oribacterium sp. FC2011]